MPLGLRTPSSNTSLGDSNTTAFSGLPFPILVLLSETMGRHPSLHIVPPGDRVIASWTARGHSLVFSTVSGTEIRAESIDCAVSIS
jgi:hypothetical protein